VIAPPLPLTPAGRELMLGFARAVEPRRRVRPSEWAEEHVKLRSETSARPGRFSCGWKPWTRMYHDSLYDAPDKLGRISVKRSQVGASTAENNRLMSLIDGDPGPMSYIYTTNEEAKTFATEQIKTSMEGIEVLQRGIESEGGKGRRQTMLHIPFPGGALDVAGGGSAAPLIGKAKRYVWLDEYDTLKKLFPGDPWISAKGRQSTYRGRSELNALGHPDLAGEGIEKLWNDESDQHAWAFDCPRCGVAVEPLWMRLDVTRLDRDGFADAARAVLCCPGCGREITDAERAAAVWPERDRAGGSGRLVSRLSAEDAARRDYQGVRVHGLCDPAMTVRELVAGYNAARRDGSESSLVEFFSKMCGEGYQRSVEGFDATKVRTAVRVTRLPVLAGGRRGVRIVCAGTDVQAPKTNPTLYTAVVAFTGTARVLVTHLFRSSGFPAWREDLSSVGVPVDDGRGSGTAMANLGAESCCIDDGWGETSSQVKEACRASLWSKASGGLVRLVPVRFAASSTLNLAVPALMRAELKRVNPTRPSDGAIDMFDLHRHSWVDRVLRLIAELRFEVHADLTEVERRELEVQLGSQVRVPKKKQHSNWEETEFEWDKAKQLRDDWLMAIVYAVFGAAWLHGLDRLHESIDMEDRRERGGGGPLFHAPGFN
jgi:hypothetical protein